MNFNKFYVAALLAILFSCNNHRDSKQLGTTYVKDTSVFSKGASQTSREECYAGKTGKSIVQLALRIHGDQVEGTLNYLPDQKDKNTGSIMGRLLGDTLLADYRFMSEGIESVRQVTFLLTREGYKEGYAPMRDQNGKMIFVNISEADYSTSPLLVRVDCN